MDSDPEANLPEWVRALLESITAAIEFKGFATVEGRFSQSEEDGSEVDILEIAPGLMEIEEAGPHDGEEIYGIIHSFDLLAAQQALDEVSAFSFGFENDGNPLFMLEGKSSGREILIFIRTNPFDDAEISDIVS